MDKKKKRELEILLTRLSEKVVSIEMGDNCCTDGTTIYTRFPLSDEFHKPILYHESFHIRAGTFYHTLKDACRIIANKYDINYDIVHHFANMVEDYRIEVWLKRMYEGFYEQLLKIEKKFIQERLKKGKGFDNYLTISWNSAYDGSNIHNFSEELNSKIQSYKKRLDKDPSLENGIVILKEFTEDVKDYFNQDKKNQQSGNGKSGNGKSGNGQSGNEQREKEGEKEEKGKGKGKKGKRKSGEKEKEGEGEKERKGKGKKGKEGKGKKNGKNREEKNEFEEDLDLEKELLETQEEIDKEGKGEEEGEEEVEEENIKKEEINIEKEKKNQFEELKNNSSGKILEGIRNLDIKQKQIKQEIENNIDEILKNNWQINDDMKEKIEKRNRKRMQKNRKEEIKKGREYDPFDYKKKKKEIKEGMRSYYHLTPQKEIISKNRRTIENIKSVLEFKRPKARYKSNNHSGRLNTRNIVRGKGSGRYVNVYKNRTKREKSKLIFLLDLSNSMKLRSLQEPLKESIVTIAEALKDIFKVRIDGYTSNVQVVFSDFDDMEYDNLDYVSVRSEGKYTPTGRGINTIINNVNIQKETPLIIITDGDPSNTYRTVKEIKNAKKKGFVPFVFSIYINNHRIIEAVGEDKHIKTNKSNLKEDLIELALSISKSL